MKRVIRLDESDLYDMVNGVIEGILNEGIYDGPIDINGREIKVGDIITVSNINEYSQIRGIVKKIQMEVGWYEYSKSPIYEIVVDLLKRRSNEVYDTISITSSDSIRVIGTMEELKKQQQHQGQSKLNKHVKRFAAEGE